MPAFAVVTAALSLAGMTTYTPEGFGRFGRVHDDGLLTMRVRPSEASILWGLRAEWGGEAGAAAVERINPTEKIVLPAAADAASPLGVRCTLLYPGIGLRAGASLRVRFAAPEGAGPLSVWRGSSPTQAGVVAWVAIGSADGGLAPMGLAFEPGRAPKTLAATARGRAIEVQAEGAYLLGEVRLITPTGIDKAGEAATRRAMALWAGRAIPELVSTSYRVNSAASAVEVTDRYRVPWGKPYSPVPPALAFAGAHEHPVRFRTRIVRDRCRTLWGPYAYADGAEARYALPLIGHVERGYLRDVRTPADSERVRLLNSLVGHLGGEWAKNAVDLGYAGMTNAQMAWAYLDDRRRAEVSDAWSKHLQRAFEPHAWKTETEPLTGQTYLWTYFIDGPEGRKYDIEWGNALPLYGLWKYAVYTGDWAMVRRNWTMARRAYRYLDLADDWAWMTVVNADHGYSTGTGDPMAAAYCGTVAMREMARQIGDTEAERWYAYRSARIAVPIAARFAYTPEARRLGLIGPRSVALGFHETEGFTRARLGEDDPWDITSVLSGDGVLPELFDAFVAFAPKGLRSYLDQFSQGFPRWDDAAVKYPFPTTYEGNSVYVTFPHIFARSALGEGTDQLWERIRRAEPNRNNAWIGPNVVAELLDRQAPVRLAAWAPARYVDGWVEASGRRATIHFEAASPFRAALLVGKGAGVASVQINDRPARTERKGGLLWVFVPAGASECVIVMDGT